MTLGGLTDRDRRRADDFRRAVLRRTGPTRRNLRCPRERSEMTPCLARDGALAPCESIQGARCVGCDELLEELVAGEAARSGRS